MHEHFNKKFDRKMIILSPGEFHATTDDVVLSTLLGSCVAACLYDPANKIIGMNHFMLVGSQNKEDNYFLSDSGRYGINAMELLINSMMKLGADKKNIKAKSFGGAHVLNSVQITFANIPANNVNFIKKFLEAENIKLISDDLGGVLGRKIFFFNSTYKVLLKKLDSSTAVKTQDSELSYFKKEKDKFGPSGEIKEEKNAKTGGDIDYFG